MVEGVRVGDGEAPSVGVEEALGGSRVADGVGDMEGVKDGEEEVEGAMGVMEGVEEGVGKGDSMASPCSPPPFVTSRDTSASIVSMVAGADTVKNWVKISCPRPSALTALTTRGVPPGSMPAAAGMVNSQSA